MDLHGMGRRKRQGTGIPYSSSYLGGEAGQGLLTKDTGSSCENDVPRGEFTSG